MENENQNQTAFTYDIPVDALKAALYHCAVKDIRYSLNGICLEFCDEKYGSPVYVVSTDGSTLFAAQLPPNETGQKGNFSIIVPSETIKSAVKAAKKAKTVTLTTLPDGRYILGESIFLAIDGVFPDWRRVIPTEPNGEKGVYNYSLLARCQDSLNVFCDTKDGIFKLEENGNGPGRFCVDGAVALCMPRRDERISGPLIHISSKD